MIFRSTPWVLALMSKIDHCGTIKNDEDRLPNEQDCLRDMIKDNTFHAREKTAMIKQWKMNAFPSEIRCYDDDKRGWERGMFLVHFAGAWAHVKEDDPTGFLMRKYVQEVV